MDDLILEPYATNQTWSAPEAGAPWKTLIGEYLEGIAQSCAEDPSCVVGHIKALALFPDGTYLTASVVSPDLPAASDGAVPQGVAEFLLSLNVIVYGLDRDSVRRIAWEAARSLEETHKGVRVKEEL